MPHEKAAARGTVGTIPENRKIIPGKNKIITGLIGTFPVTVKNIFEKQKITSMKGKYISTLLLASTVALSSCGDFLSEYSQDQTVASQVSHFDELMLGSGYLGSSPISSGPNGNNVAGFFNILDDDVNTGRDRDSTSTYVSKAWLQSLQGIYGYFGWQEDVGVNNDGTIINDDAVTWNTLYNHINVINVILDEIATVPHDDDVTDAAWLRVQGEAYFCRAQFYFTLANLYGKPYDEATAATDPCVPLKLTPNIEHKFSRASVKDVYAQVVSDLTKAKDYLTRSPQNTSHLLHRASAEAAHLLQSRVYLYMQDWEKAEAEADSVMKSENFHLAAIGSLVPGEPYLTSENDDVIFSQGSNNIESNDIFTARPGDFCVSRDLYELYDSLDRRRTCFFGEYVDSLSSVSNDSIILRYKYERGGSLRAHISDAFCLRMSEAYLNKAEACAMQDKTAPALQALNALRAERIEGYTAKSYQGDELIRQVRDERRKELCFEGHRWFDLRRYGVSKRLPLEKNIVHVYNACGDYVGITYTRTLVLPPRDLSYTFAIPKSVMDFFTDGSMTTNERPERDPLEKEQADK